MKLQVVAIYLLCTVSLAAQSSLEQALTNLEKDSDLRYAAFGFCAIDVEKNEVLAQRNAQQSLIPASTLKLATTATALAVLGANYRYETFLEYEGTLTEQGVLKGNLYLRGTGDPSLGSPWMPGGKRMETLLTDWSEAIWQKGIRRVEGRIYADALEFETSPICGSWQIGDVGNYYGTGIYGLNIYDNFYRLTFERVLGKGQQPKVYKMEPSLPGIRILNLLETAASNTGERSNLYTMPYSDEIRAEGTLPAGRGRMTVSGAMPNPPLFAVQSLEHALQARGVSVRDGVGVLAQRNGERQLLHVHRSPRLWELVKHTNEESRNHYCEAFMRTMAKQKQGRSNLEAGITLVKEFWSARGLDTLGWFLQDGSGLSARNGIPALVLAQLLRKAYVDKANFPDFEQTLPIAGKTGTMKSVGRGTAALGKLRAKTGTLGRIRCYAGYVQTRSGKTVAFALFVNNYVASYASMRRKLDVVLGALAELD